MIKKDIFTSLNEDQKAAAVSEFGNILVLAGAGTGKTSTIAARAIYLLRDKKIEPRDIILLTFTKKASVEMKERLKVYIDDAIVDSISVSTFHALCLGIIKKYYPQKKLISETDAKNLLDTTYSRVIKFTPEGLYSSSSMFLYINNYINSDSDDIFSVWLEEIATIDEENKNFMLEQYQLIYDSYAEDKNRYDVLAFSDLLVCAREYLSSNENTIKEMIVDEFQDTNPLQNSTIRAIDSKSLFCVGDYDQSIYAFNGADLKIIEEFKERSDFRLHNLSKNYRCTKPILDIAEKVIVNNKRIYPKKLEVMVKCDNPVVPYCIATYGINEQYEKITTLCQEVISKKTDDETVAILYRTNGSGNGIEFVLREHEVEFERNVKNTFMENMEIQIIFNVLKLILFRNIEYLEFMNLFIGVVKSNSKEAIESYYNMITYNGSSSVYEGLRRDAAKQIGVSGVFNSDSTNSVESLLDILEFNKHTNVSTIISNIIQSDYFNNTLNRFAEDVSSGDDERANKIYQASVSRSESILNIAKRYTKLQKFYQDMTRPNLGDDEVDNPNKVSLMTVHSSKGLEFDYVFVIDLDDDMFPNKKLMGNNPDDEERRLFYVACTRAKSELVFSYSKRSINNNTNKPSRFLLEAELVS